MAQRGLLDMLGDTMQSPMFLAGAGLLSGEGFGGALQGMQVGSRMQEQARQREEQMRRSVAFADLLKNLPQGMSAPHAALAQAAGPEAGIGILASGIPKPKDPLDERFKLAQILKLERGPDPLDAELKRAQIAKLQNEVQQGGRNRYGLNVQYAQHPETGSVEPFVTGHDGSVRWLDLGDKRALGPFGIAEQRKMGSAQGDARANMSKSVETAGEMLRQVQSLKSDEYLPRMLGPIDGRTPDLTASAGRVASKMDQIKGSTFLSAYERLKGGGQITEIEGKKAEEAIARLNRTQSHADYVAALGELEQVIRNGMTRARVQAGELPPSAMRQLYDFGGGAPSATQAQQRRSRDLGDGFSVDF